MTTWLGSSATLAALTFDVDAEAPIFADSGVRYADWPGAMSHQAYGPTVAMPRLLSVLADFGLRATFFVPGLTADRYPRALETILASGHEVAHHGYTHRSPIRMDEGEERRDIERGLAALERHGVRPAGYRTPSWEPSTRTFGLLAEYGFAYDSTLMDDDRPYLLETGAGALAELPPHWSLDDWNQYAYMPEPRMGWGGIESPRKALELWGAELDAMRRYGCLFVLTMHPFLSGRPARAEALRALIEQALAYGDVELLTCGEIAERALGDPGLPRRPPPRVEVEASLYPGG